jgi:hypothetical protein
VFLPERPASNTVIENLRSQCRSSVSNGQLGGFDVVIRDMTLTT